MYFANQLFFAVSPTARPSRPYPSYYPSADPKW